MGMARRGRREHSLTVPRSASARKVLAALLATTVAMSIGALPVNAAESSVEVVGVAGPWVGVEFTDDGVLVDQESSVELQVSEMMVDGVLVTRIIAQ